MAKRGRLEQTSGPVIDLSTEERKAFHALRKSLKISQEQLAAEIGVSNGTISNIETGSSSQPRREPYMEALRYMRSLQKGAPPPGPDRAARFKRVMEKYMLLDERGEAAVEAVIDSQLTSVAKSR